MLLELDVEDLRAEFVHRFDDDVTGAPEHDYTETITVLGRQRIWIHQIKAGKIISFSITYCRLSCTCAAHGCISIGRLAS